MATLTLRQTAPNSGGSNKNAPLSNAEVDANFNSLDATKVNLAGDTMTGTLIFSTGSTTVAPCKLVSGTNLTTAAAGSVEFDGTNLYFTPSGTRKTVLMNDSGNFIRTITGTANQITVSGSGTADRPVTLTTPQDIATTSSVTFGNINAGTATGTTTGQIKASADIIAFASSDERLKKNIVLIPDALHKVLALRGVHFTWDADQVAVHGYEGQDTGVIAQDVARVLPEVVTTRDDGFMAVKYEKMMGLLIEAIKELNDKVDKCNCSK